jgi:hypothetical protein
LALPVTNLRIAAAFVTAIVTRVRRHRPSVGALRFFLFQQSGNVTAERFTLFVLRHREISHGTEYRNCDKFLDHVPPPLLSVLCRDSQNLDEFAA